MHSDDLLTRVTHRTGADGLAAACGTCGLSFVVCGLWFVCILPRAFVFFHCGPPIKEERKDAICLSRYGLLVPGVLLF